MGSEMCIRDSRCRGLAPRLAAVLEGGYNLETLPGLVLAALGGFSSGKGPAL